MLLMIDNAVGVGFQTLGIGMLFVIGILSILMVILYLLIPIFRKIANGKSKTKQPEAPAPAAAAPAAAEAPVDDDEGDVVAAIIAAISQISGAAPSSLKVVSFKRIK